MSDSDWSLCGTAALAVLVGATGWAIGLSWLHSVVVASAVLTVGAGKAGLPVPHVDWSKRDTPRPHGTRGAVAQLSWRLVDGSGAVSDTAARRLLPLAQSRLARHGVDLFDPRHAAAAEGLLGSRAYRVLLTAAGRDGRPVRKGAFLRCVAAVERLDDVQSEGATVPSSPSSTPEPS